MVTVDIPELQPADPIIAVLGLTGSGKSTFVSQATGLDAGIGHGLASHTARIGIFTYEDERTGRRAHLADMPGLNDTLRADVDVLQELGFFFAQARRRGAPLAGVVYLHPVTSNRVAGSAARSLRMLERLCGERALGRVVLATTMWDKLPAPPPPPPSSPDVIDGTTTKKKESNSNSPEYEEAERREAELIATDEFWGSMVARGSRVARFTGDRASALAALSLLTDTYSRSGPITLQIQHELVDENRELWATSAAHEVASKLIHLKADYESELVRLRALDAQTSAARDAERRAELSRARAALEKRLRDVREANSTLQARLRDVHAAKEAEYARVAARARQEQEAFQRQVEEEERRLGLLQEEEARNAEIYGEWEAQQQQRRDSRRGSKETLVEAEVEDSVRRRVSAENAAFVAQYRSEQDRVRREREAVRRQVRNKKRKVVFLRNVVPVLQMLGGIGCIAAGAATGLIPVAVAGVGLLGTGVGQFSLSSRDKRRPPGQGESFETVCVGGAFNAAG